MWFGLGWPRVPRPPPSTSSSSSLQLQGGAETLFWAYWCSPSPPAIGLAPRWAYDVSYSSDTHPEILAGHFGKGKPSFHWDGQLWGGRCGGVRIGSKANREKQTQVMGRASKSWRFSLSLGVSYAWRQPSLEPVRHLFQIGQLEYKPTMEILRVHFQTTATKRVSMIKWVTQIFWLPSAHKVTFTLYCSLLSMQLHYV